VDTVTNEEFIAVVDSRFEALLGHLDSRFEQIDARFEQIDARFEHIDRRFDRIEERLTNVETGLRYANVQIESLWGETKRLAETIALVDEKLERFRAETHASFENQRSFNDMLVTRFEAM
jgi:chromosome segregation ATPase